MYSVLSPQDYCYMNYNIKECWPVQIVLIVKNRLLWLVSNLNKKKRARDATFALVVHVADQQSFIASIWQELEAIRWLKIATFEMFFWGVYHFFGITGVREALI